MTKCKIPILLILVTALYLSTSASTAEEVATVHVINGMVKDTVDVLCAKEPDFNTLKVGQDYSLSIPSKKLIYCDATWGGRSFTGWHAYQPRRDANRSQVFWLVKESGVYLSWDKSSWIKKAEWEAE